MLNQEGFAFRWGMLLAQPRRCLDGTRHAADEGFSHEGRHPEATTELDSGTFSLQDRYLPGLTEISDSYNTQLLGPTLRTWCGTGHFLELDCVDTLPDHVERHRASLLPHFVLMNCSINGQV